MNQDNRQDPRTQQPQNWQQGNTGPYYAPQAGAQPPYWQGGDGGRDYGSTEEPPFQRVQGAYPDPRAQQPQNWQQGSYPNQPYGGQNPQYQNPAYGNPQHQGRPPYGGRPAQRPPRRPHGNPLLMTQTLNDFRELFSGYASAQPLNAFKFDLSSLTWPLLLLINVLLYALTKATAVYCSLKNIVGSLSGLSSILGDTAGTDLKAPWGLPFLYSFIEQILVLGVIVGMGFLIAQMTRSEKRPPLQFVKTLAVATIPHSVMHFIFLFAGIALPKLIMFLSVMAAFFLIFTYFNGFIKLHPSKRGNYWWFLLMFVLVALVLYLMPYSLPKLSLA